MRIILILILILAIPRIILILLKCYEMFRLAVAWWWWWGSVLFFWGREKSRQLSQCLILMSSFFFFFFLPLLVAIALIDLATMGPERRARLWRRSGLSQRAIADRMGVSRYRVRKCLAV